MDPTKLWQTLIDFGATWGVRIIAVTVALVLAAFVSRAVARALTRTLERRKFDLTLTRFFGALIRYAILGGAIIGCLGVFGIQTASFAAVIAAIGLAIGLALQGTLSNFAAGVMLLVFRPFNVGDLINVAGQQGIVEQLQLFTTDLCTLDNRKLVVPNSQIFGHVIENITHHETRRVDIDVGVAYSADIDETRRVLETVPGQVEGVLQDPAPQILPAAARRLVGGLAGPALVRHRRLLERPPGRHPCDQAVAGRGQARHPLPADRRPPRPRGGGGAGGQAGRLIDAAPGARRVLRIGLDPPAMRGHGGPGRTGLDPPAMPGHGGPGRTGRATGPGDRTGGPGDREGGTGRAGFSRAGVCITMGQVGACWQEGRPQQTPAGDRDRYRAPRRHDRPLPRCHRRPDPHRRSRAARPLRQPGHGPLAARAGAGPAGGRTRAVRGLPLSPGAGPGGVRAGPGGGRGAAHERSHRGGGRAPLHGHGEDPHRRGRRGQPGGDAPPRRHRARPGRRGSARERAALPPAGRERHRRDLRPGPAVRAPLHQPLRAAPARLHAGGGDGDGIQPGLDRGLPGPRRATAAAGAGPGRGAGDRSGAGRDRATGGALQGRLDHLDGDHGGLPARRRGPARGPAGGFA